MDLVCDKRSSDFAFVETIWRSQTVQAGPFISMADNRCAIVITKQKNKTVVTVRGPETKATRARGPTEAEYVGIRFKLGVFMPYLPAKMIMDRHDVNLPRATSKSFWLNGSAWEIPDFENADTFVNRLVRDGMLVYDPVVDAILRGEPVDLSTRQIQRRFLQSTGLTYGALYQIERARHATTLIKQGVPTLDTVFRAGYFDQSHLIRSLKHFIGLTPGQILDPQRSEPMSFLYNTRTFVPATILPQQDNYQK